MNKDKRKSNLYLNNLVQKGKINNENILYKCTYCGKNFNKKKSSKKRFCSSSCKFKNLREKNIYKIKKEKICIICNEYFLPKSTKNIFCDKHRTKKCAFCEEFFTGNLKQAYCDTICQTLSQHKSKIYKNKINDYKNINLWAENFIQENNRKIIEKDIINYFNISSIPKRLNTEYLQKKKRKSFF